MNNARLASISSGLSPIIAHPKRSMLALVLFALLVLVALEIFSSDEPEVLSGPPQMRRLTQEQYRASIADIFAPDIEITARFEMPIRSEGLIAVGTGKAGMSPFAVEQYDAAAQGIAATVLGKRRGEFLPCGPLDPKVFDDACAREFLGDKGRLLFRRQLTDAEIDRFTDLTRKGATELGDFYQGLELSLYVMLVSPEFLYRIERMDAEAEGRSGELDAYSKAARLSFFLTNSTPDDELLTAAEAGDLDGSSGIRHQTRRLMDSPRFEGAVRAFFADMLQFDKFGEISKDPSIFPAYNSEVAADAQEQTLRTIAEHLIADEGDYRDLFTTRDTYLTRALGPIYHTPVPTRGGWEAVSFTPDANRAGIQSHISFLALHAHPGQSSPTLRGYAVRRIFLCQDVPDPPANVDFTAVEQGAHKEKVTARDRLELHATNPSCAGCHKVMDPLGLTLENYDGVGVFRTTENGGVIDTSGSLDGTDFNTTAGLAEALRDHPEIPRCVVQRLYNSAVGRDITWNERYYLDWLIEKFADDDYRIPELMQRIATSRHFYQVTRPASQTSRQRIASQPPAQGGAL